MYLFVPKWLPVTGLLAFLSTDIRRERKKKASFVDYKYSL